MSKDGWRQPRPIVERIIITADVVLQSSAHFGGGDVGPFDQIDMVLLRDPLENRPLLPGASIAGALRSYLREWEEGYRAEEAKNGYAEALFGVRKRDTEGLQSPLIVYDALAEKAVVELRDGVKIDPVTRTAEDKHKFDLEVLAAGTRFPLRFELVLEAKNREKVLTAAYLALHALGQGEIGLGARKQRGLGQLRVENWQIRRFDLTQPKALLAWLVAEQPDVAPHLSQPAATDIKSLLPQDATLPGDKRCYVNLQATFALDGSLLIRAGFGRDPNGPDTGHLHSRPANGGEPVPLVPGSSLTGVLRHRALRIANTLHSEATATTMVNALFGYSDIEDPKKSLASRVRVRDTEIKAVKSLVQNRVRIDRFTGGAFTTGLFSEEPVFGDATSSLNLDVTVLNPDEAEVGLLLQVLKDLWVGDLAVGGESSIGRGRLQGLAADLVWRQSEKTETWRIDRSGEALVISGDKERLNKCAKDFASKGVSNNG